MQFHKPFYQRNLPHYQPQEGTFFLTYRLYGSIPISKIRELREQFELLKKSKDCNSRQLMHQLQAKYFSHFDAVLDKKLNEPYWLRENEIAKIVSDSLHYNNGKEYELWAFTIMPNHVHALISLLKNSLPLYSILQRHKRHIARQCNKLLKRTGHFWEDETYDHLVTGDEEFENITNYILNNPVKAGLVNDWREWKWNYLSQGTNCKFVRRS